MPKHSLTVITRHVGHWNARAIGKGLLVAFLPVLLVALPLVLSNTWARVGSHPAKQQATSTSGAQWTRSVTKTAPTFAFSPPTKHPYDVDRAFKAYYDTHAGVIQLGQPITLGFPVQQGWVQFFTSGALLLPSAQKTLPQVAAAPGNLTAQLIKEGETDGATGVVVLPVLHALLGSGSEVSIGGQNSSLTYVDLRQAAQPAAMVPTPAWYTVYSPGQKSAPRVIFVPEGQRSGYAVGHMIPSLIWNYINQQDTSPNGWQVEFGQPLTEALNFTAMRDGATHQLLAQAFWRTVVIVDETASEATGQSVIQQLDLGVDYLQTFGPPATALSRDELTWVTGHAAVLDTPETGRPAMHADENFPLALMGDSRWADSALWYHVRWKGVQRTGEGWVPASSVTFIEPQSGTAAWASFDVLSADLASYLASQGSNAGAVVYDVSRQQYYTYNAGEPFIMASSAKVPIMLTFLAMTESQGREPNDDEMYLLTTMIENSNNNSAQALFDEVGGAQAMESFMQRVGIPGLDANPYGWGWSTVTPLAMVRLLTLLHEGAVLNARDRTLAINLMENVEPDQRMGAGDTAPSGAIVAMKDGWVPAPDGLWAANTSAIITKDQETYIISVYTQDHAALSDGWAITDHVSAAVGQILTSAPAKPVSPLSIPAYGVPSDLIAQVIERAGVPLDRTR